MSTKRDVQADSLKQQMLTSKNGSWGSDPPTSVRTAFSHRSLSLRVGSEQEVPCRLGK